MENNKTLEDKDVIVLYKYLCEYEKFLKNEYGQFNIYDEKIKRFKNDNKLYLGSINRMDDKKRAVKSNNYLLWKEGSLKSKNSNVDRAHALLRRIRNAFAHGNLIDNQNGTFHLKDADDNGPTLDGTISYSLLYQLIEELRKTNNKH